jgi:hypothetical protein
MRELPRVIPLHKSAVNASSSFLGPREVMVCLVSPFDCILVDRALSAVIGLPPVDPRLCTVLRHYRCTVLFSGLAAYGPYVGLYGPYIMNVDIKMP